MSQNIEIQESNQGMSIKESIYIVLSILIYQLITIFILLILDSAVLAICGLYETKYNDTIIYVELLSTIISYILLTKKYVINKREHLKFVYKLSTKIYLLIPLILIGYHLAYDNTLGLLISNIDKNSWFIETANNLMKNPTVASISILLVAPIFEEIFFRGIILEKLSRKYSQTVSILISAALFGIFHFNFIQGVNAFFIGIILAIIYIRTGSLVPCILFHFENNLLSFISDYLPSTFNSGFSIIQLIVGVIILLISMPIFINSTKSNRYRATEIMVKL